MLRRPKPGEGEEDILKMQEEFLRERNKQNYPAAQVVDVRGGMGKTATPHVLGPATGSGSKRGATEEPARRPSKYAQAKGLTKLTEKRPRIENSSGSLMGEIFEKNMMQLEADENVKNVKDDPVYFPKVIPLVMGDIIEKNLPQCNINSLAPNVPAMTSKGFPSVRKRNPEIKPGAKSIFSQQIELERVKKSYENSKLMDVEDPLPSKSDTPVNTLATRSFVVTSEDADSIHRQNIEVLSKMSQEEIFQEQQKLLASLDPKVVNFIKSKRAFLGSAKMDTSESYEQGVSTFDQSENSLQDSSLNEDKTEKEIPGPDTLWENDILSHPDTHTWINFDTLEKDKMEWMKGIEECKKHNPNEPYEARFNFKGYLLPYSTEYNEQTKTLFHHGDEPHRPGYTLLELFTLTRSSIIQQRVTALNIIAGILEYYSTGMYKDIIEIPITKIFFVIRVAMDESALSVLEPALRAMSNLLYNRVDESCLDALLGLEEGCIQPFLDHDKAEVAEVDSKESELKDFHLADIDMITGAVRVDIIPRLQYILEIVRPPLDIVQYSLQILTRIVRDSGELGLQVVRNDFLMKCIVENFIPLTGVNFHFDASAVYTGKPILAAVKFIRILALQSSETADILDRKFNVTDSLCSYIDSEVEGTYGLRIQIEAFSALNNLVTNGVAVDKVLSLNPVLVTLFFKHIRGTDLNIKESVISCTHAAVLIRLISRLLLVGSNQQLELKAKVYPLVKQGFIKWINQTCVLNSYTYGHLRLACAILDCVRTIVENEQVEISKLFVSECKLMEALAHSNGFKALLGQLIPSSNLLSSIDNKQLHTTKNLSNMGSTVIDSKHKVLPVLSMASPIPFFTSFLKLLHYFKDSEVIIIYVKEMFNYLAAIHTNVPKLCENWFTRMEIDFIFCLLKIISSKNSLNNNESEKDLVYAVANKLCYILRCDKVKELNYIFENIVFNKNWFTVERLINLVSLTEGKLFTKTFSSIDEIRLCYTQLINTQFNETGQDIVLRIWQEPILPRDWIYLPIVKLYSDHQVLEDTPQPNRTNANRLEASKTVDKKSVVSCCLEWILFNEMSHMKLVTDIDITDRFCRIMCVFLCDNSLFLEPNIKILLEKCIEIMFKYEKECPFNFDKDFTGLNNFQDFYTQFLEQFQAVSYGDPTFAACVLAPLAQKHNVKWRKLVWSEYVACVRSLDCPEEKLCYDMTEYLFPEEKDESVLKSYVHALSTNLLRPNTISFKIAEHHALCFKKIKLMSVIRKNH